MEALDLAKKCKALGDPTRVRIFQYLATCACSLAFGDQGDVRPVCGPTVGEICCEVTGVDKITSTMSFHLKELREAGLISMEKQGKYMICSLNHDNVKLLAEYFALPSAHGKVCCG